VLVDVVVCYFLLLVSPFVNCFWLVWVRYVPDIVGLVVSAPGHKQVLLYCLFVCVFFVLVCVFCVGVCVLCWCVNQTHD